MGGGASVTGHYAICGYFPTTGNEKNLYPSIADYCPIVDNDFIEIDGDNIKVKKACTLSGMLEIWTNGTTANSHYGEVKVNNVRKIYATPSGKKGTVYDLALAVDDVISVHIYTDNANFKISQTAMVLGFFSV